jgi:hypothetical protein
MAQQLSHCGELWNMYWRTNDKVPENGQITMAGQNNNGKHPFAHNGKPNGMQPTKGWSAKGTEATSAKTFEQALGKNEPTLKSDPFAVLGRENVSHTPNGSCTTIRVKGWDRKRWISEERMAAA